MWKAAEPDLLVGTMHTKLLFILLPMLTLFYMLLMWSQWCTITLKEDLNKDTDEQSLLTLKLCASYRCIFSQMWLSFMSLHWSVLDWCIQLPGRHLSGACAILRCNSVIWSHGQKHRFSILWTIYINMLL